MWLVCSCRSQTPCSPVCNGKISLFGLFLAFSSVKFILFLFLLFNFILFYLKFRPLERWERTLSQMNDNCLEKKNGRKQKLKYCLAVMLSPLCYGVSLRVKTEQTVVAEETSRELASSEAFQV